MTFSHAMELWARWLAAGCRESRGFHSQLHMMMVTRCEFTGATGHHDDGMPIDGVEAEIEAGLLLLRQQGKQAQAQAVIAGYCWSGTDPDKAYRLDVSLRTFERQKQAGRLFLLQHLAERRGGHWRALLSTENVRNL